MTASTSHATATDALAATGVLNGYGNGEFLPNHPLSRAEFTRIVADPAGQGSLASSQPQCADAASIPSWAWGYVNAAGSYIGLDPGDSVSLYGDGKT